MADFNYIEWQIAKKGRNYTYANYCKEQYRIETMKKLIKVYHMFHEKLKMFPLINLN